MLKKLMLILIVLLFLLSMASKSLCLAATSSTTSNCCPSDTTKNNEDCLSHCAKQKLVAIKTDSYPGESFKAKACPLESNISPYLQSCLSYSNPTLIAYYLNQADIRVNVRQIYLVTVLNHAPPILLK